ncbi:MAG: DUF3470 domain-containing protein [Gammaproteobacteria bacterium]|nr:DUF3470 domain-containing protein [Gammaproteobacteria bacterium]MYI89474.1 DUF3470 domain-containing protein [Gammaproteobacteria bacterium]
MNFDRIISDYSPVVLHIFTGGSDQIQLSASRLTKRKNDLNLNLAKHWLIAEYRKPPPDAEEWTGVSDNFRYLSMEG